MIDWTPELEAAQLQKTREERGDLIAEAITGFFGERCSEDQPGCICCDAWHQYDIIRGDRVTLIVGEGGAAEAQPPAPATDESKP